MRVGVGLLLGVLVANPVNADGICGETGESTPPVPVIDGPAAGVVPPPGTDWRFEVTERQCVFEIAARDEAGLDRLLAERAANGTPRWHGLTRADFDIRFDVEPVAAGCRFAWLDFTVEISLWLPHWQPLATVRMRPRARWEARLEALRQHERAHREQKLETAVTLYRELAALESGDCAEFDRLAHRRIERALLWLRLKSESLDVLTDHGRRPTPR